MTEPVELHYRPRKASLQGERVLVLDLDIPDSAPAEIKEGLSRRAIVNAGGVCPCGAWAILPNRAERRRAARLRYVIEVEVPHEPDCPALLRGYRIDLGPVGWSR
jgi:hypothetical protein